MPAVREALPAGAQRGTLSSATRSSCREDTTPDLIIMEVTLPGTSGFEVYDLRMQDETQLTSIILITASRTDETDAVRVSSVAPTITSLHLIAV